MLKSTKLTRNLAKLMLVAVLFVGCSDNELKIGQKYAISFDYEEQNPFKIKDRDTVKIVGLKGNYIQWQYSNGGTQSSSIREFNMLLQNSH